jgi:hypothetical protein
MSAPKDQREVLKQELIEYYDCPKHLVDSAVAYIEAGHGDPAEVVEALIEAYNA